MPPPSPQTPRRLGTSGSTPALSRRTLHLLWLLLISASTNAWAQTASLGGTVLHVEDNRLPVANARVTASSPALDEDRVTVTDDAGAYQFPQLPPGLYALRFEADGFIALRRDKVNLRAERPLRVNVELMLDVFEELDEEQIPVAGVSPWPVIDAQVPTTRESIELGFTDELARHRPAQDFGGLLRSFDSSLALFPGTRVMTGGLGLHGVSPFENETLLDGLSIQDPVFGTNALPLPEAFVGDLSLVTSGALPDDARAAGANITTTTPSSHTRPHGAIFATWTPGPWEGARTRPQLATGPVRDESLHHFGDLGGIIRGPLMKRRKLTFVLGAAPTFRRMALPPASSNEGSAPASGANFLDRRSVQVMGKLEFAPSRTESLSLSFITLPTLSNGFAPVTGTSTSTARVDSTTTRTSLAWSQRLFESHVNLQAQVGWLHRGSTFAERTPLAPTGLGEQLDDRADRYQANFQIERDAEDAHVLKAGVNTEYLVHERDSHLQGSTSLGQDESAPRHDVHTTRTRGQRLGAFVQDVWSPLGGLSISGGLRYDLQRVLPEAGGRALLVGNRVSPRLGVTYGQDHFVRAFAQFGMAMSQVPLGLVEAHTLAREPELTAPTAQDFLAGMDARGGFNTRLSLQYLHRALHAPISDVRSAHPSNDRTYDAVTVVLGRNDPEAQDGLQFLLSYTWSRLMEEGHGRVRLAPASTFLPDMMGMGEIPSSPVDRPHTVKAFVAWTLLMGQDLIAQVGLSYLGESGARMLEAPRRLDWHHSVDAFMTLGTWDTGSGRFVGGVDVFNLLNFQTVTRTDALGAPSEYQSPRQVRLQARYTF
ncbi:TonB-dependent receptor [Myxococcus landrumensis]|uniref:TonB-dependent receptor n=1 Tax=Myxococcus landrumensis TaxID=2813577 RepID=A0ABX7N9M0_9BACT|nr:TonB-dependent receptor [Myxococcus landrumus]QSQ15118.1 TonB-dependent receptor [Myxococcus landrumus]